MKILETHIVPAITEKIRLQEYGVSIFTNITSRSRLKKAIKRGEILIDGEVAVTSHWILPGQKIELLQQEKKPKKIFRLNLDVTYEDSFLAVINKPKGYPTSGNFFKTIENALPFNLKVSEEKDALPFPLPVHRLDNPTSGLLLIAKTGSSLTKLNLAFQEKRITKIYLALVYGSCPESFIVTKEIEGKPSKTTFSIVRSFQKKGEIFSLVEAYPETGRTHQIRIHLSNYGHPIVGDQVYGMENDIHLNKGLFLAAIGLNFGHPETGEELVFKIQPPQFFQKFLSHLEPIVLP